MLEPPDFGNLYRQEVTQASFEELKALMEWCNRIHGYYPVIIGGWAVWAYTKGLGSRDIDVVLPTRESVHATLRPFYAARGYHERGLLVKRFVRIIEVDGREEEIQIDGCSFQDSNILHEDNDVTISWQLLSNHQQEWELEGLKARLPTLELLLLYKVKAYRDRRHDLEFRLSNPAQRLYLQSKTWKDRQDIQGLMANRLNRTKLDELLRLPELTPFGPYLEETLKELD